MGKKGSGGGSSSWLTAVKRAFRSPSKDSPEKKSSTTRKDDQNLDHEDDEDKKKERRRWLFRKPSNQEHVITQNQTNCPPKVPPADNKISSAGGGGVPVVVEVAEPPARIGVEVGRTIRPTYQAREQYAAIVIQTAFRGYLARRALRALKGLVKLQALVRGHNVRKQAKMTLKCMQALVRVQARVLDQRMRLSQDGSSRKSTFSDTHSVLEPQCLQDISDRKSMCLSQSREGSSVADDWDDRPHTIEEVKAMLLKRKEAALKREKPTSHTFSQQIPRTGRRPSVGTEDDLQERPQWLDRWVVTNTSRARASTDQRDPIKTLEIDTSQPYSYFTPNFGRANQNSQNHLYHRPSSPRHNHHYYLHQHQNQLQRPSSPLHGSRSHPTAPLYQSPTNPSPVKSRPIQVRSASPRCIREDRSYCSSQTPSLRSNYYYSGNLRASAIGASNRNNTTLPNYMAATESAKARARSQSAPRQRPSTPERDRAAVGPVKKRLSYPVPDPSYAMKSPSLNNVGGSHFGGRVEQQSNYSSCCTESLGSEISTYSTTDLRRWLR